MKQLFFGGTILTMEAENEAEAILTDGGRIAAVGSLAQLRSLAPEATPIDLAGSALLPAFLDAHGHFSSYANAQLQVALDDCASFAEIGAKISDFLRTNAPKKGEWVLAKGYDHNTLAEKRQPDRALLDSFAPDHPLLLQHQSGHCGVANSRALEALSLTAQSPVPSGGARGVADGQLTGYLEESAYIEAVKQLPMADLDTMLDAYRRAQDCYFSHGITTVQEGMMVAQMLPLYRALLASGLLRLDLVGYSDTASMEALLAAFPRSRRRYEGHFKIGGYKVFLDGSPQVKTAWMKTPYLDSGESCGYGTMADEELLAAVRRAAAEDFQLLAHCNGDAAAEQYLNAVETVAAENAALRTQKPVMIHAQLLAKNQLARVAALGMIPSFFVAHVLHWGDIHIRNFGLARASAISPAHSALEHGIRFTFHQDAPVIEPDMLETVQCAVLRRTRTGVTLGGEERISVLEALRAVSCNAAYQYSEEDEKGSLRAGKRADFVILSENPLAVSPEKIAEISVLATIKDGVCVFRRK